MGKKKLFTEEQELYILENYKKMSNKDLSVKLNCKPTQINSWLLHRGIKRGKEYNFYNSIFSKEDVEFIINNYSLMTSTEIAARLGFTKSQIEGKISKLNLNKKHRILYNNYFSVINSPLKAYFLGFIYADGYVVCNYNKKNYEFGMELQSQDKYILERLNSELGGNFIIYHKSPKTIVMKNNQLIHSNHSDVIRVYSKKIVEDLINIGIVPNKSRSDTFPRIDDKYFFDFLRGYIDGDGCYYNDSGHTYMHITCSSKNILIYIKEKLSLYNIQARIYKESDNKFRLMCVNTTEMTKLINRLYYKDDLFYLKRKYNKIKHFIGFAA